MDSFGPKEACIRGAQIPNAKGQLLGETGPDMPGQWACPMTPCRVSFANTAESIDLPFGFVDSGGPKEAQVQSYSPGGVNEPDDTLPRAVQKWLNRSICRLDSEDVNLCVPKEAPGEYD